MWGLGASVITGYAAANLFFAVTKEDIDTLKDDWLTDNVRYAISGSNATLYSLLMQQTDHCVLGRVGVMDTIK